MPQEFTFNRAGQECRTGSRHTFHGRRKISLFALRNDFLHITPQTPTQTIPRNCMDKTTRDPKYSPGPAASSGLPSNKSPVPKQDDHESQLEWGSDHQDSRLEDEEYPLEQVKHSGQSPAAERKPGHLFRQSRRGNRHHSASRSAPRSHSRERPRTIPPPRCSQSDSFKCG